MMKYKSRILVAVFLGVITAKCGFDLAGWSYNPFHAPFVLWKTLVRYGVPIVTALIWLLMFQAVFKLRNKS